MKIHLCVTALSLMLSTNLFADTLRSQHSQSLLSVDEISQAWALTPKDVQRYQQLMQGQAGVWYQDKALSPIDILGLYAETEADKTRFAEMAAKLHFEKISRELAYNHAVQAALERLYPSVSPVAPFDVTRFAKPQNQNVPNGRWVLVTNPVLLLKPDVIQSLLSQIDSKAILGLDIYFLQADSQAIQRWASLHQLPKMYVDTGLITLNFAHHAWDEVAKSLPQWFKAVDGELVAMHRDS